MSRLVCCNCRKVTRKFICPRCNHRLCTACKEAPPIRRKSSKNLGTGSGTQ